jgi:hypothetical protein
MVAPAKHSFQLTHWYAKAAPYPYDRDFSTRRGGIGRIFGKVEILFPGLRDADCLWPVVIIGRRHCEVLVEFGVPLQERLSFGLPFDPLLGRFFANNPKLALV